MLVGFMGRLFQDKWKAALIDFINYSRDYLQSHVNRAKMKRVHEPKQLSRAYPK